MIDKIKINNRLSLSKNKRKKFSMQGSIMQKMHEHKISGGYLTLLRLTLGFTFLTTALSNLFKGAYTTSGFITTIEFFINQDGHVVTPFDSILRDLIYPYATFIAIGWMILEFVIALSLIFGVLTRLGSVLGVLTTINLGILTLGVDWPWTYVIMFVGFVTCALTSAGKWYGLDFWIKDKLPEKLVIILI
jgi:thiosulfate dehydrogenase [quinone] large subunit